MIGTRPAQLTTSDLDRLYVWHPYTRIGSAPPPIPIARAEGVYLYDESGKRYIDAISSWWVNIHGHNHPALNRALKDQLEKMEHVMFAGFTHEPAAALAEALVRIAPKGEGRRLSRVFYSDNGSTAVETALKMAVQYWRNVDRPGKKEWIALRHAYHGDTLGAMSVSAPSVFTEAFEGLLLPVERASPPYCYRCPLGLERSRCDIDCLAEMESLLEARADRTAAVIVEPMVQAAGGMILWPPEYLARLAALCREHEVLLITDEVMTGFGRTGRMFGCEHAGIVPDILCLSKALTGGYLPLAATLCTEEVYGSFEGLDPAKTFYHGHSYTANPLACAVARASLKLFEEEPVLERVRRIGEVFRDRLPRLRKFRCVGDVRFLGGIGVVELVSDKGTKAGGGYLDGLGPFLNREFLQRGILLRPLGHVLYIMPPYVTPEDDLAYVLDQVEDVLEKI